MYILVIVLEQILVLFWAGGWNNVASVQPRNIFGSRVGPCKAFLLDI